MKKKFNTLEEIFKAYPTKVNLYDGSKPYYPGHKPTKELLFSGCSYDDKPIICIQWSEKGRGFGEYTFYEKDGKLYCNNECDDKATVSRIMLNLVNQAIFIDKPLSRRKKLCKLKAKSNSKLKSQTQKSQKSQKDS